MDRQFINIMHIFNVHQIWRAINYSPLFSVAILCSVWLHSNLSITSGVVTRIKLKCRSIIVSKISLLETSLYFSMVIKIDN